MRMHRFIGDFDLSQKTLTITDEELVSQWRTVLRLKTGDTMILSDGKGLEATATIIDMGRGSTQVSIADVVKPERGARKKAELFWRAPQTRKLRTHLPKSHRDRYRNHYPTPHQPHCQNWLQSRTY